MKYSVPLFAALLATAAAHAGDATYTRDIAPIVEKRCDACHGAKSPEYPAFKKEKEEFTRKGVGPRMDTYAHLAYYTAWPDTGALMRRLDDGASAKEGKPGNMYVHLGDSEEERKANLALFKAWVGNWTVKRWNEIPKEELSGIAVPY